MKRRVRDVDRRFGFAKLDLWTIALLSPFLFLDIQHFIIRICFHLLVK